MTAATAFAPQQQAPTQSGVKRKLIRGGIALGVLVAVAIGVVGLLPGLSGVRSAIGSASPGWVLAAAGIQMVGTAGGVEGLGSVGVSAVAELQGVTSGFDRYIDGPVQFHRPARLSVDHYAVVPRRTSAPIALCVSLSVAAIIDLPLGSERRSPWYSATDATSRQRPSTSAGQREPLGRVIPSPLKYPRGHRGLPLDGVQSDGPPPDHGVLCSGFSLSAGATEFSEQLFRCEWDPEVR